MLSIALLIKSEALRKQVEAQKREYQKSQKEIMLNLMALRDNIWEDKILSLQIVSKVRTQLFSFEQNFNRLLTHEDKRHLKITFELLNKDPSSIEPITLCIELDYFIARFEKKELL